MIFKELDAFDNKDKFQLAGRKAEEQMAFYFRRFFAKSDQVDVLNYLRIDLAGEIAQMDHLVLHPFGILIVESKSVTGSVQIKDDGQWIRWYSKQASGMRSPVTQAQMQGLLLKELLATGVKQKGFFDRVRFDVLVAISDSGTIQWPSTGALPEVCKADQVHKRINDRIANSLLENNGLAVLAPEHRRSIAKFLQVAHRPLERSTTAKAPLVQEKQPVYALPTVAAKAVVASTLPLKRCKHCGGEKLEAKYGQYGYYFLCKACEKNTGIKFVCPACAGEGRIRKQGLEFFAECKSCEASSLFHTNA